MASYIVRRLLEAIPTFLGITIITFLLVHMVPGGPAQTMLGNKATPFMVARLNHQFGLDKPLPTQYILWLWQVLHLNLGNSYYQTLPVWTMMMTALPNTLAIVGIGTILSDLVAILQGLYQAHKKGSVADHTITVFAYFFWSMPIFWLGVLMIIFFAIDLNIFPPGGIADPGQTPTFTIWLSHIALPIITFVIATVAFWGRFMRASVIDSLVQDYIRTARAKGLKDITILFTHAFRNSLLPLVTLLGLSIPGIFSGALIVESVFNYPGLGLLFWNAAIQKDYPIVLGTTVVIGVLTILGNLVADLLYAVADPRIQYS